jgi:hypothetical protein
MSAVSATRVVDHVWISREPIAFRALCERAIPPEARLVVLDLDRTLHLGRNMGELLGWEISAYRGYGPSYLVDLEPRRAVGRMCLSFRRPLSTLRYLWRSGRVWAGPGLYYLLWCKIASRVPWLRRWTFARFGPEPVHAVQRLPQDTLFAQIASLPGDIVRELARRVWARHAPDQTVEREDLTWLRRRCPAARIVLSSASPREIAEVAARELGFDEVIASAPGVINGGRAKLAELRARHPELCTPGVLTVGISDTGYGEDHCWTEAFTHVVDVNSGSPFPPLVSAASPLRAVFSALVLTRAEKEDRVRGDSRLDPRRGRVSHGDRDFAPRELEVLLAPVRAATERLVATAGAPASELAYRWTILRERARRLLDRATAS